MSDENSNLISEKPLSNLSQFISIEPLWRQLHAVSPTKSIFLSFDYIKLWYSCFARPEQVRIYPIISENKLIGFLPLVLKRHGPVRVLSSLTNDHCLHAGPLVLDEYKNEFFALLSDALILDKHNWDILCLFNGFSFDGFSFSTIERNLNNKDRKLIFTEQTESTYTISLKDSFSKYLKNDLSANMRSNYKRLKNRLMSFQSCNYHHFTGEMASRHWSTFLDIEDSGWKGKEGTSINKLSVTYRNYYNGFLDILAKNERIHMYFLELDSKYISGALCYVDGNVLHWDKVGYREDFSSIAPSNMLLFHIIEDAINSMPLVDRIHLFPWDSGYKYKFVNEESNFSSLLCFSPSSKGHVLEIFYHLKVFAKKTSRKLYNRLKPFIGSKLNSLLINIF